MMDRLLNFFSVRLIGLILVSTVKKSSADCSKNNTIDENDRIEFKGLAGHLTSPGYPAYFKDTIQCTWHIYVNMRHSIELEFEFFDFGPTEACSSKETESQFIEVRDGARGDSEPLGRFCGNTRPQKLSSSGSEMWIRLETNGYRSIKFKATYKAVRDSPSTLLVVAGVSTIVGLMMTLLLLTLYLKRKRRNSDEENTSLAGSQNQESEQNCTACGTSRIPCENITFTSVAAENSAGRKESLSEHELVISGRGNEKTRTQSLGAYAQENLAPVVE